VKAGCGVETDHGLFGPDSVTWRIMKEPVIWVAGFRALYLQALHPRVMRGTWQNTSFVKPGEAWGRFVRTTEFVGVRTYGTTAQVDRAARRVRKLHASLTGTDADGTRFRLNEPELLLWVHCGEVASYVDIARRSGLGLSGADLDAFVGEQRRSAAVVGLDPDAVPPSVSALNAYYEAAAEVLLPGRARGVPGAEADGPAAEHARVRQPAALGAKDVRDAGQPAHRRGRHRRPAHGASVHDPHPAAADLPARRPGGPPAAGPRAPGRRLTASAINGWGAAVCSTS